MNEITLAPGIDFRSIQLITASIIAYSGLLLNALLLYLIFFKTTKLLNDYKIILIQNCLVDIFFTIVNEITSIVSLCLLWILEPWDSTIAGSREVKRHVRRFLVILQFHALANWSQEWNFHFDYFGKILSSTISVQLFMRDSWYFRPLYLLHHPSGAICVPLFRNRSKETSLNVGIFWLHYNFDFRSSLLRVFCLLRFLAPRKQSRDSHGADESGQILFWRNSAPFCRWYFSLAPSLLVLICHGLGGSVLWPHHHCVYQSLEGIELSWQPSLPPDTETPQTKDHDTHFPGNHRLLIAWHEGVWLKGF